MKTSLFISIVTASAIIASASCASPANTIDVQGHRGARSVLPENSLAGFQYALNLGVDTIELDMVVTADDVVVVSHDPTINADICQYRNGDQVINTVWIRDLTLAQIKQFDCGTKTNPQFPKQQPSPGAEIPTLAQVFKLVQESPAPGASSIRFNIETKINASNPKAQPAANEFITLVLAVVDEFDLRDRVTIQSFDPRTLAAAKELAADITRAFLLRDRPRDWLATAKATNADIIAPYYKALRAKDVRLMQDAGLKVIPWTVNNLRSWKRLIEFGVDGIITDDPLPLMQHLGRLAPLPSD